MRPTGSLRARQIETIRWPTMICMVASQAKRRARRNRSRLHNNWLNSNTTKNSFLSAGPMQSASVCASVRVLCRIVAHSASRNRWQTVVGAHWALELAVQFAGSRAGFSSASCCRGPVLCVSVCLCACVSKRQQQSNGVVRGATEQPANWSPGRNTTRLGGLEAGLRAAPNSCPGFCAAGPAQQRGSRPRDASS